MREAITWLCRVAAGQDEGTSAIPYKYSSCRRNKFVASMRWTYLNTKLVGGYNAKYSEWYANVDCRTRTGVVTKVLVKGSNNVTLPILGIQLSQMRRGLQNNAMSKLIYMFCG